MTRRAPTVAMIRRVILAQAAEQGRPVLCGCGCGEPLNEAEGIIREHVHALALGGADEEENMRLFRAPCARLKTIGTAATTAGSDIHMIAKGKRLRGETCTGPKAKIRSRGFPKVHRPLRGRAFS